MSDEGRAFVKAHSPYVGNNWWFHYVMGDLANAQHDYEIFISDQRLAREWPLTRSTCTRARQQLIADGYLESLAESTAPGRPRRYRFTFKGAEAMSKQVGTNAPRDEARSVPDAPRDEARTRGTTRRERASSRDSVLLPTEEEQKSEQKAAHQDLCEFLQRGVEHHRGVKPKMTAQWPKDMDLLMRLGPLSWAKPAAIAEDDVRCVIRGIFTRLNLQNGGGFCWADQIRSPTNLRKHWDELVLALEERPRQPTAGANDTGFLLGKVRDKHAAG
jgi:hypothetical protein